MPHSERSTDKESEPRIREKRCRSSCKSYAIEAFRSRLEARFTKARRRCRNSIRQPRHPGLSVCFVRLFMVWIHSRYQPNGGKLSAHGSVTTRNTDSPLMKSNIAIHSMRLAMSRKVGMTGRLREGEVESVCNPFITLT